MIMGLNIVMCFVVIGVLGAIYPVKAEDCFHKLSAPSNTILLPTRDIYKSNSIISCSWRILALEGHFLTLEIEKFNKDAFCDCNCGQVSIQKNADSAATIYCQNDLPVKIRNLENGLLIKYDSAAGHGSMESTVLFKYYNTVMKKHRSVRDIGNQSTNESNVDNTKRSFDVSKGDSSSKFGRLPVIIPATLTVVIFIACVAGIAYKNYNIEEFPFSGSSPDIVDNVERDSCCSSARRSRNKKHVKNDLYDVMLKQYKEETNLRHPSRKSSAIHIEGVRGTDPQSIAQKHLILRSMREPNKKPGAVSALIKLSSRALLASSFCPDKTELEHPSIPEEESALLVHHEDENINTTSELPLWQQGHIREMDEVASIETKETAPEVENMDYLKPQESVKKRNSGSAWFKYKKLEKQAFIEDSDDELTYDCAQHIQRILSASRENLEEARRILPDDVKDIVLPEDLEAALAEFELWPDSSV